MNIPLSESNTKDKTDVLDWATLPRGRCDLNFRKPGSHPPGQFRETLGAMLKVSLVTVVIAALVSMLPFGLLVDWTAFRGPLILAVLVAMVMALGVVRLWPATMAAPGLVVSGLIAGGGVLVVWLLAGATRSTPAVGLMLLDGVAVPATAWLADALATHWVYWCTANPRIDRATMTGWRADWSRRFTGSPDRPLRPELTSPAAREAHRRVMGLRRAYLWGFLWLLVPFFVVPMLVLSLALFGLMQLMAHWIVLEITLALIGLSFIRALTAPQSWRLYRRAIASWNHYGRDTVDPPWMFQSPGGSQLRRAGWFLVPLVLLAVAVFTLLIGDIVRDAGRLLHVQPGDPIVLARLVVSVAGVVVLPVVWFLLAGYLIAAPALAAAHWGCDTPGAYEQHSEWGELDGYFERLRNSRNPIERRHLLVGYNPTLGYCYLLDIELLFEHFHILGATGIGKTALGLSTHTIQLIRRNDGPVIIVDCKGDPAFFHTARIEAERAGRTFKWFTNKPHRSTYVFNPLDQSHLPGLTLPEMIGLVTQSLNLHHGDDYGRAWFSIGSRVLLKAALLTTMPADSPWVRDGQPYAVGQRAPVLSFRDLEQALRAVAADDEEYRNGKHLLYLVESLADFEQLNLAANASPDHPALRHAIHMPEVIEQKQVIYFYLVGAMDVASVGELARLVLYSTLSAAIAHRDRTGERPRVYFIADEAQALAAKNLEMVLAQAREHGLACILAHQTLSQLNPPGGVDLRELVMNCTALKQYFSARDPVLQKYISDISGTVRYADISWDQFKHRVINGEIGRLYAAGQVDDIRCRVHERLGPRLETEDLHDISRNLNQSIFVVNRASGYSRFHGAFPMHSDFPVEKRVHDERREQLPWPDGGDATLKLTGLWPQGNNQTVTPTTHPGAGTPAPGLDVQERLRGIRDQLRDDE